MIDYHVHWIEFLNQIEESKQILKITESGAWFRGQLDTDWDLMPSILRDGGYCDADDFKEISREEKEIEELKKTWKEFLNQKKNLKKEISQIYLNKQNTDDLNKKNEVYHEIKTQIDFTQAEFDKLYNNLLQFKAPIAGERDLFDDYVFKSGKTHSLSSWEILAEMRHYGVPTRLLDWTDRLDIALFFALSEYRIVYEKEPDNFFDNVKSLKKPCIWILNPYNLTKHSTGRSSIIDFVRENNLDYYQSFLVNRNWKYSKPIPIYPPTSFDRIRAQRGFFTVFGNDKQPLNKQVNKKDNLLIKIDLNENVIFFYLKYLNSIQRLSPYEIYQDLDTLGDELNRKFRSIQKWTKTRHNIVYK
ncbi:FRG domain-containing protein [Natronoflexus pectinivorans]|uniref:FRG domain-containing protein n=1 Tax=Natronoflexus pectinivorans TaxID=682526 RepID=A0A4R2G3U8_9BACT|nr:FRG domain-containing protein [Natronoflexus pectinivorans]TCO02182.1 FRG domain-containing protein [Natronoflexus pectinivorans]